MSTMHHCRMAPPGDSQKRKADGEAGQGGKRQAGQAPSSHPQSGFPIRPPPGYGYGRPPGAIPMGQSAPLYGPGPGMRPPHMAVPGKSLDVTAAA